MEIFSLKSFSILAHMYPISFMEKKDKKDLNITNRAIIINKLPRFNSIFKKLKISKIYS